MNAERVKELIKERIVGLNREKIKFRARNKDETGLVSLATMYGHSASVLENVLGEINAANPDTARDRHWQERAEHHKERLYVYGKPGEDNPRVLDGPVDVYLDTAFSDTLKDYLERLEQVEHDAEDHIDWHKKQADDQLNITVEEEG